MLMGLPSGRSAAHAVYMLQQVGKVKQTLTSGGTTSATMASAVHMNAETAQ